MLTRRHVLIIAVATIVFRRAAWAQSGDPTRFITSLGDALVEIVNSAGPYEDKKHRLVPLIERDVDVDGIARFCLGRFSRTATPGQMQNYVQLFHQVLLNNIFGKLGQFQGVTFKPTSTIQTEEGALVGTLIQRPNQQANNVQWVVNTVGGQSKIIDVKAEGTSLRLTQRNDYSSYLSQNGGNVDALIAAMKRQLSS